MSAKKMLNTKILVLFVLFLTAYAKTEARLGVKLGLKAGIHGSVHVRNPMLYKKSFIKKNLIVV